MKETKQIIEEINKLVASKGYIYALCMILVEDFSIQLERLHEVNYMERLNTKEASLLLGFLIQNEIDFSVPEDLLDIIQLKKKTHELLLDLHEALENSYFEKLEQSITREHKKENFRLELKEFFGDGEMFIEPIFYSSTGVFDFQYLDFLKKKYKYDLNWLYDNKKFELSKIQDIASQIKNILQEKLKIIHFYSLKEEMPKSFTKQNPTENGDKHANDILPLMEMHQYVELFLDFEQYEENLSIRKNGLKSFCKNLIELFIIKKTDFNINDDVVESFFNNFSIMPKKGLNSQFQIIGNYNLINSHPIIKLDTDRFFVPLTFLLFESIYESPFYWMMADKKYKDLAAKNRGNVGEEIAFEFLSKVFGPDRTFRSVKITTKKGRYETDIDILCILGSKALCVQVKSKKLTELSKTGDDKALNHDFNNAIQEAYKQGLLSRQKILEKKAIFIDSNKKIITLSEEINDVYIMGITTENYPSLSHQCRVMLDKAENDPFPIFLNIFDLELLAHYLADPYDFLYYIKQRISLMDYFIATEEIEFLGYHLMKKLCEIPNIPLFRIDTYFGQLIDRNYSPSKMGVDISNEGDAIKKKWSNKEFDRLCNDLKKSNEPKVTDILFHLFDWPENGRDKLVELIISMKQKTLDDDESHDFSIIPDENYSPLVGISYIYLNSNDPHELMKELITLCIVRKYKSKGDVWIGFGSLKNSPNMIDYAFFADHNWQYDEELEKTSKILLENKGQEKFVRFNHTNY